MTGKEQDDVDINISEDNSVSGWEHIFKNTELATGKLSLVSCDMHIVAKPHSYLLHRHRMANAYLQSTHKLFPTFDGP